MTRLCGNQLEVGAQSLYAHVDFQPNSRTDVEGSPGKGNIWLPSSSLFITHACNDRIAIGLGNLGYFGSDLVYKHHWVGRYYVQKSLLEGISLVPAAAYKINDQWSVGGGLNVMYGFFKQRSAVRDNLDGRKDGYFNMHDYRFGYGGVFGILFEPDCCTRLGVQYLTPVTLDFRVRPHFNNLGPVLEGILRDLGIIGSKIKLKVRVPQSVIFSFYYDWNDCWSLMGNAGWQQWSQFQKAEIHLDSLNNTTLSSKIKYQDTWHGAFGLEWHLNPKWTFSGGIAYDTSAISNSQRPLDFPVGDQWRFGSGARWKIRENLALDFSTELQWMGNLKCHQSAQVAGNVSGTFKNTYAFFINTNLIFAF